MGKKSLAEKHAREVNIGSKNVTGGRDLVARRLALVGVAGLIFFPPYVRGLFFPAEQMVALLIALAVFTVWWAYRPRSAGLALLRTPLDYAALAVVGAYLVSIITAVNPRGGVQEVLKHVTYFIVYWLVAEIARNLKGARTILNIMLGSAIGVALVGLGAAAGAFAYPGAFDGMRISSTIQYPNSLAAYLAAAFFLGLTMTLHARRLWERMAFTAAGYILLLTFLFTYSRAAWLLFPPFLVLFVAGMPRGRRLDAVLHATLPIIMVAIGGPLFARALAQKQAYLAWLATLGPAVLSAGLTYVVTAFQAQDHRTRKVVAGVLVALFVGGVSLAAVYVPRTTALGNLMPTTVLQRLQTIRLSDRSALDRFLWPLDALKIVKDHPITGVGGRGWSSIYTKYQSYGYASTEVHNHLLQTWAEAGTVGLLALLSLWLLALRSGWQVYRVGRPEGLPEHQLLSWGLGVSALGLMTHSVVDFNLSLGAISIYLWALFGVIAGLAMGVAPASSMQPAMKPSKKLSQRRTISPGVERPLVVACSIILFAVSGSLLAGHAFAQRGATLLNAGNASAARPFFEKAVGLDPLAAPFHLDLGQAYEKIASQAGDQPLRIRAKREMDAGIRLDRYNAYYHNVYAVFALRNGDIETAVAHFATATELQPFQVVNHENLARARLTAGINNLKRGETQKARAHLANVPDVLQQLQARRARIPSIVPADLWPPTDTPSLLLTVGASELLLGRWETAEDMLAKAAATQEAGAEAKLWLAALYQSRGEEDKTKTYLSQAVAARPELAAAYDEIRTLLEEGRK